MRGPTRGRSMVVLVAAWIAAAGSVAQALDVTRPAQVRIKVADAQGRALAGTRVRLLRKMPAWPILPPVTIELTTDAQGTIVARPRRIKEDPELTWNETVLAELKGYVCVNEIYGRLTLFPGAQIDRTLVLDREQTTLIRLRGSNGEPLAGVGFSLDYSLQACDISDAGEHFAGDSRFIGTDERGEYRWVHGKLRDGFQLQTLDWGRACPEMHELKDQPVVTLTFPADKRPVAGRLLQGKLLLPDGRAAAGWFVPRKVRCMGTSGAFSGAVITNVQSNVVVEDLARVGADGAFATVAEGLLAVISPQGIPILYSLNPQTWPSGTRQVRLQLPDARRLHHGQVVDERGHPVQGLPLDLNSIRWLERNEYVVEPWRAMWDEESRGMRGARATDGTLIEGFITDSRGNYTLPTYFGSVPEFSPYRDGWQLEGENGPAYDARSVWHRAARGGTEPNTGFQRLKDVTIVLEDDRGHRVERVTLQPDQPLGSKSLWVSSQSDDLGDHLFLDRSVDRVTLSVDGDPWHGKISVQTPGSEDRTVRVRLGDAQRMQPLRGTIIDPDGKPLAGAPVRLLTPEPSGFPLWSDGKYTTRSDRQGKFAFAAAPDDCRIAVGAQRWEAGADLPGWCSPVAVNRRMRQVDMRLDRGGIIRVLLPPGGDKTLREIRVRREDRDGQEHSSFAPEHGCWSSRLTYEARGNCLQSGPEMPGWYHLENGSLEPPGYGSDQGLPSLEVYGDLSPIRVQVKAGETAVVDLRNRQLASLPPRARAKAWTTVLVKHNDRPASGAEVTVFTDVEYPENVARWIQQWQSGDADVHQAALAKLSLVGALAVDAIRASGGKLPEGLWLKDLEESHGSDGLSQLAADLTDDTGQVRFEAESGRHCVAVARQRGRFVGWQEFTAQGGVVTVALRSARTLLVPAMQEGRWPPPDRYPCVRLERVSARSARGLMRVLCPPFSPYANRLEKDILVDRCWPLEWESSQWFLEDLPVGEVCELQLQQDRENLPAHGKVKIRVQIESGLSAQRVVW